MEKPLNGKDRREMRKKSTDRFQQSGDPAACYRLHPGPAAGAGDAPCSAETAATARATAPPGRGLSGCAAADPAHCAQHGPGRRREQAGRQHSVPLSRAGQVCGSLSTSESGALEREGQSRNQEKKATGGKRKKSSANLETSHLVIPREREREEK
uniref:uncharacterized protein LOC125399584 n=1 Tax=Myodes glareolus TaxID=447135 RepID=UPI00202168D7|nr:uncharacterized protein LOC125399584 [Myodes glareolus]